MRSSAILTSLLVVTYIAASEAIVIAAALALGGLAALKGAALVGYSAGRHNRYYRRHGYYGGRSYGNYHGHYGNGYGYKNHGYRYGRSVENSPAEEGEDLLLSAVGQLDPNGCVLKLLCQIQIKDESKRTLEEAILVDMFANNTESLSAYNEAFVYATDIGIKSRDISACKKYFPNCPLNENQLDSLLNQAWGCGFNFGQEEEQQPAVEQEVLAEQETPLSAPSLVDRMRENVSA